MKPRITFIDLQKNYDSTPTSKLLEKLDNSNISNTPIKVLKKFFNNSKSRVEIDNHLTKEFVTTALRQECCFSQTLFKIFVASTIKKWKRKFREMAFMPSIRCRTRSYCHR